MFKYIFGLDLIIFMKCNFVCVIIKREGMSPPPLIFTNGAQMFLAPIDLSTCLTSVIFDSAIKYSNHLTNQHENSPQHFVWI